MCWYCFSSMIQCSHLHNRNVYFISTHTMLMANLCFFYHMSIWNSFINFYNKSQKSNDTTYMIYKSNNFRQWCVVIMWCFKSRDFLRGIIHILIDKISIVVNWRVQWQDTFSVLITFFDKYCKKIRSIEVFRAFDVLGT